MADDADTFDAQERGAAILGIIEALLERIEGLAGEDIPHLGGDGAGKRLLEHSDDGVHHALADFQGHVADEAVADDDVDVAAEEVAALDVAHEVEGQGRLPQAPVGLPHHFVPLGGFFPDGEQPHPRALHPEHHPVVDLAHDGKLLQVLWAAVNVGAHVEQHRRGPPLGGKDGGQGGPVHARQRPQLHLDCGHGRPGVAGADNALGLALPHLLDGNADGSVGLAPERLDRALVHGDDFAGGDDFDGEALGVVATEVLFQQLCLADQLHGHAVFTGRQEGALDLRLRGVIAPHSVNRDGNHQSLGEPRQLFGLDRHDRSSAVVAAVRAHAMGQLGLVAVGTLPQLARGEGIVGAPLSLS